MKTITLKQLVAAKACSEQVRLFKKTFGDSVEVSPLLAIEVAGLFDWDFAARNFLTPKNLAEYNRVKAPALAEYNRVTATAWAEYNRVMATASAEYERVTATALAEYNRVTAPALAEYERVKAVCFVELYLTQGE